MGQNITEEEIDALKQNYEQAEENGNTLTMQQLDSVAGGGAVFKLTFYNIDTVLNGEAFMKGKFILNEVQTTSDNFWHVN